MKEIEIKCRGADTLELDQLITFQGEIKKISKGNLVKLKKAIIKHGFVAPIFIWKRGNKNYILDGHQRTKALQALKVDGYTIPPLPVTYITAVSIKDAKEKLLHIASQYGEFNREGLDEFIIDAKLDISDLQTIRLTSTEFKLGSSGVGDSTEGDDNLPEKVKAVTKFGDIWQLGEHKIICADCTDERSVKKLFGNDPAQLLLSDPPYCSGGFQESSRRSGSYGSLSQKLIANDQLSTRGYQSLIRTAILNINADLIYLFTDWKMWTPLFDIVEAGGYGVRNMIVWAKESPGMGMGWRSQHEIIIFGTKIKNNFNPKKAQGNVIQAHRTGNKNHPTEKPVELLQKILEVTDFVTTVCDPFLGSGSTLIACDKTGHRCLGMELTPHYCDVAVRRYLDWRKQNKKSAQIKLNGKKIEAASLLETGPAEKENTKPGGKKRQEVRHAAS